MKTDSLHCLLNSYHPIFAIPAYGIHCGQKHIYYMACRAILLTSLPESRPVSLAQPSTLVLPLVAYQKHFPVFYKIVGKLSRKWLLFMLLGTFFVSLSAPRSDSFSSINSPPLLEDATGEVRIKLTRNKGTQLSWLDLPHG
ncbi:unnamed protein product [Natator depressus]